MSIILKNKKTAIILLNLGGPDSLDSVKPFLFNLFNDPAIIGAPSLIRFMLAHFISFKRNETAKEIYSHMGGKSPIVEQTVKQADALKKSIIGKAGIEKSDNIEIFITMRYWHPMSDEVVEKVKNYNPDNIILLPLYPQLSSSTTLSSFDDWEKVAKNKGLEKPIYKICCYPENEGFASSIAKKISEKYDKISEKEKVRILFSAHGLPEKIINKGDPYQYQVEKSVESIVNKLNIENLDYVTCYQSRVGPLKWIGPSTDDEIIRAGKDSSIVILVPVAFVSEHSETLVELDIEYKELAEEHKIESYYRIDTVQDDKLFIDGLADLCINIDGSKNIYPPNGNPICPKKFIQCPHLRKCK